MANSSSNVVLVYGIHAAHGLLVSAPERVIELFVSNEQSNNVGKLLICARSAGIKIQNASVDQLDDWSRGRLHQGVLIRAKPAAELGERELNSTVKAIVGAHQAPVFLALDHVQDPHNLGACIRTAEAAGINGLIVSRNQTAPLNDVARKVACGAVETLPVYRVANLVRALELLKKQGVWVLGTSDQADKSVYQSKLEGALCLVMGSEGAGLKPLTSQVCDERVSIPMQGAVSSVNISVATGIVLFEWVRQSLRLG